LLLQVLYSVRSERMLMEQLEYNLLFRWFVRLGMDDDVWAPTTFTNAYDINNDQTIVRAACKIGFNYAAKILGCETIRQRRFDAPGVLLGMTRLPYKLPQRGKGQCSSDRMLNPRESTRAVSAGTADSYVSW